MRTVWKFQLQLINGPQEVTIPIRSRIIHAQMQNGIPCFWAVVNTDHSATKRTFVIIGTGNSLTGTFGEEHIQSFPNGEFMWHLFETDF